MTVHSPPAAPPATIALGRIRSIDEDGKATTASSSLFASFLNMDGEDCLFSFLVLLILLAALPRLLCRGVERGFRLSFSSSLSSLLLLFGVCGAGSENGGDAKVGWDIFLVSSSLQSEKDEWSITFLLVLLFAILGRVLV